MLKIKHGFETPIDWNHYQNDNPNSNLNESKNDQETNIDYIPQVTKKQPKITDVYQNPTIKVFPKKIGRPCFF